MNHEFVHDPEGFERDWPSLPSPATMAWTDFMSGSKKYWIWTVLALHDIKLRYRGSILGPFWLTISTIILVASMGVIYSKLFNMELKNYFPYLALGLIIWGFISAMISDGCQTFIGAEGIIQTVPMPFSVHVYRTVYRNLLAFAHNLVIVPVLLIIFQIPVTWRILEIVPALVLYAINGIWISVFFGMLSARFRDVPPIVTNFTQVLFFLTPIIFPVSALGEWKAIADYNPVFAAIDVVRAPMLGVATNPFSWPMLLLVTLVCCVGTFFIFARFRSRIAYWI
jgi:ABC-2 type transport system permease protein/lipopolysaccharide transport system permease protein